MRTLASLVPSDQCFRVLSSVYKCVTMATIDGFAMKVSRLYRSYKSHDVDTTLSVHSCVSNTNELDSESQIRSNNCFAIYNNTRK